MGAGDSLAGAAPAGHDPVPDPSPAPVPRPRGALLFDGAARDYLKDANGNYRVIHWVDQKVALKLVVNEADVAGVPTLGSRLKAIRYGTDAQRRRRAEDVVRFAIEDEISGRQVELVSVDIQTPSRGKTIVIVRYRNLLLLDEQVRRVEVAT